MNTVLRWLASFSMLKLEVSFPRKSASFRHFTASKNPTSASLHHSSTCRCSCTLHSLNHVEIVDTRKHSAFFCNKASNLFETPTFLLAGSRNIAVNCIPYFLLLCFLDLHARTCPVPQ